MFSLANHVAHQHWDQVGALLDAEEAYLRSKGFVDAYLATVLERGAGVAAKLGQPALAERCLRIAVEQWLGLEEPLRAQEAGRMLNALRERRA